jgi:hypothetical protein
VPRVFHDVPESERQEMLEPVEQLPKSTNHQVPAQRKDQNVGHEDKLVGPSLFVVNWLKSDDFSIIQAVLGCLDICDHSILTEALKIMRNGERIVKCKSFDRVGNVVERAFQV